jgi:hypothetical protein
VSGSRSRAAARTSSRSRSSCASTYSAARSMTRIPSARMRCTFSTAAIG